MCCALFSLLAAACTCRLLPQRPRIGWRLLYPGLLAVAFATTAVPNAGAQVPAPARVWMPFSHLGTGVTFGTTGFGVEAAVPYGAYWNIHAGISYLGYTGTYKAGTSPFDGHIRLGGGRLGVDWFPRAGGFHISLGVWAPNLTQFRANLNMQPGKTIKIEGVTYGTDSTHPFHGTARSSISPVAPVLSVRWGNPIPRDYHQRWSFPIEIGAAYEGPPTAHVSYSGDISPGRKDCRPASLDAGFNKNLNTAVRDANSNLDRYARFFPILSAGFAYRF